jgi:5-methyltetrahydropteroyltriglutamate--homocysteine methyltransferase
MKSSTERILTSHAGSLPRPDSVLRLIYPKETGQPFDREAHRGGMRQAVADIVHRQTDLGVDIVNDGEQTKSNFIAYVRGRLGGFEILELAKRPVEVTRDAIAFPGVYEERAKEIAMRRASRPLQIASLRMRCVGPVTYIGQEDLKADIAYLKAAMKDSAAEEAFMTAISPSNLEHSHANEYYRTSEEYLVALGEAMRVEYQAIIDAGFILQIDDPRLATHFDRTPGASIEDCRKFMELKIEALNHALRGLPEDRIRFHTCYSTNVAPRVYDLELQHYVDLMLKIRAAAYSFEAANPRHDHEWQIWENVKLPDGKILMPGVVSHCVVLVEHPELVAQRIVRYADVVGRENVIAGNDCGFATSAALDEVHSEIAWAKLQALTEGARIASKQLWSKTASRPIQ